MADESTQETQNLTSPPEALDGADTPVQADPAGQVVPEPATAAATPENTPASPVTETASTQEAAAQEPDAIQPFIDKTFETIQHEVAHETLDKFLRAHIKTFHEEWESWTDTAKDVYVHMMAAQLVQRKAAATQIGIGNTFKLPEPSAQTQLFESIKQALKKPEKRRPVLLMPPNLRPTYSLKK
jgi:hypothetical protein